MLVLTDYRYLNLKAGSEFYSECLETQFIVSIKESVQRRFRQLPSPLELVPLLPQGCMIRLQAHAWWSVQGILQQQVKQNQQVVPLLKFALATG